MKRAVGCVSRGYLNAGATRQYAANKEKSLSEELPIPDHFGWTEETFKGMDAWEIQHHMKCDIILSEVLKIPKEQQADFKRRYEMSEGHWSLEWCHPSPMPFHTYTDDSHLPIIKETADRPVTAGKH